MRWLPWLLLAGCAPASDGVILRGEPFSKLPHAWLCWRSEPAVSGGASSPYAGLMGGTGLVIYQDGRAESVTRSPAWGDSGTRTTRRSGTVSAADRAELEKALAGPLAPPVRPVVEKSEGFRSDSEGGSRYLVEIRGADGSIRSLSYSNWSWNSGPLTGGEPLHPLLLRILRALPE